MTYYIIYSFYGCDACCGDSTSITCYNTISTGKQFPYNHEGNVLVKTLRWDIIFTTMKYIYCTNSTNILLSDFTQISWVCDESTWVGHSTFTLCGAPLCFLKETEGRNDLFAVVQTYTICACRVTLSSSSNIQTSVQFKLAGHGPVTYFPKIHVSDVTCSVTETRLCVIN